ncbi:MAG: dihydrofolate reductase family protein [Dehalococcoidia bacterium]
MRVLTVNTFLTLDGVMQAPGGPGEDPTGGFTHEGWSVNYWDDMMGQVMDEFFARPYDLLLGRKTYEIFAAHWPHVKDDPAADTLNAARKYVASRTLDAVDWQNSTLLKGDVGSEVAKLKEADGPEIQVHGSSNLIQTLLRERLIDEFRLWIFPLMLGSGKRLFSDGTVPSALKLVDSKTATTGVVVATYRPAGEIEYGSFALEEPSEAEARRREQLAKEG